MKPGMLLTCSVLAISSLIHGNRAAEPPPAELSAAPGATNQPVVEISPGTFQIGQVRLSKERRAVSIPAVVNMRESPVEYLLVHSTGKIHESILRTEAQPVHIHLAMLLLGAKGAGTNAWPEDPALPLPGNPVAVEIRWITESATHQKPGEDFVLDFTAQKALTRGDWTYTGSGLFHGTFLAQQEGSIISLFIDPVALINNPRPGREEDENWRPNALIVPPDETAVEVVLRLHDAEKTK